MAANIGLRPNDPRLRPEWDKLLVACQQDNAFLVAKFLQDEGISANHANAVGQSALHIASLWCHVDCVALLLEHGANIDATNQLTTATPLHSVCHSNRAIGKPRRVQTIEKLIQAGADPNAVDQMGRTPIECVDGDDPDLEQIQAVFNSAKTISGVYYPAPEQEQALLSAIKDKSSIEQVQMCLEQLATSLAATTQEEIDELQTKRRRRRQQQQQQDQQPQTPLEVLVELWCDISEPDSFFLQVLQLFINTEYTAASSPDTPDSPRTSTTTTSLYLEHTSSLEIDDMLNLLCQAIFQRYRKCKTVEDALVQDWIAAVSLLLPYATTTTPTFSISALWLDIARRNYLELAKVWSNRFYIDPSTVVGRQGMTPLHFAARSGHLEMVQYLVGESSSGSDSQNNSFVDKQNDLGQTALQAAQVNQHEAVVQWLEERQQ